ncbi:DMT family transporter [Cochlodiniinecator piscidefendens]|uniref:DMT family transporter n=1 Tax=Cochlodiniinecator piscidefendens TaxID=2715756 RepID=UPI00140B42C0|nr:DMT family transporter [Cochlodiniinecator piscidefendens]
MQNLRGIFLVVVSMLAFSLEDMFIKLAADYLPTGQILILLGMGGASVFAIVALKTGERLFAPDVFKPIVLLRNFSELSAALFYVTSLSLIPISTATAILQATPLFVTCGAALFLGETVGWRRWSAVAVGLIGVLLIVKPGMAAFQPEALFAVAGAIALAARDLATRRLPSSVSSGVISFFGFISVIPAGLVLLSFGQTPVMPNQTTTLILLAAVCCGVIGYQMIVSAMRMGEASALTPFRYIRMIYALLIGVIVFHEQPDQLTLIGAALILATGLYAFARERALSKAALATQSA